MKEFLRVTASRYVEGARGAAASIVDGRQGYPFLSALAEANSEGLSPRFPVSKGDKNSHLLRIKHSTGGA